MTLLKHEIRQGRNTLAIWTSSIALLIIVCLLMFPEMKSEMESFSSLFASLGSFTQAFGMDKISFGTLMGFYAVECGNILGLCGGFFAALLGASALSKEEKEHTAEFLLTHPIRRSRIVAEKLLAVLLQLLAMNAILYLVSIAFIALIGESIPWKALSLLHLAYLLLQIELAALCFGLSAFTRRGSQGIGIGLAAMMYFLNLVANISDSAAFLKYITPFGYAEGSEIVSSVSLDVKLLLPGMLYAAVGILLAHWHYCRKDIH